MDLLFLNCYLFYCIHVGTRVGTSDSFINMGAGAGSWVGFVNLRADVGSSLGLIL